MECKRAKWGLDLIERERGGGVKTISSSRRRGQTGGGSRLSRRRGRDDELREEKMMNSERAEERREISHKRGFPTLQPLIASATGRINQLLLLTCCCYELVVGRGNDRRDEQESGFISSRIQHLQLVHQASRPSNLLILDGLFSGCHPTTFLLQATLPFARGLGKNALFEFVPDPPMTRLLLQFICEALVNREENP
ncbi:hypothetical protein CRG98_034411 [Punica granatum]|uniref:Uncharacterized protein n=1 Tax=Punica granatum TaxID=22663 RepID=A0A2I0INB9_PUNGR|nr:hypothetical protein CRG98_034411 [Punica granatum]